MANVEKMIEKVRKLLALAGNNPSEEEAKAAALKAQELIAQYNLDMTQETGDSVEYKLIRAIHSNNEGYRKPLSVILAENFRCRVIIIDNYVHFFGREGDVEACTETFNYLYKVSHGFGLKLERQYRKEGRSTKGVANSYWSGFMHGIRFEMGKQSLALAIVVPQDVHDKFSEMFPSTVKSKGGMNRKAFDFNAYSQGVEDGRSTMSRKQLTD